MYSIHDVFNCANACGNGGMSMVNRNVNVPSYYVCIRRLVTRFNIGGMVHINDYNTMRSSIRLVSIIVNVNTSASSGMGHVHFGGRSFTTVTSFNLLRATITRTHRLGMPMGMNGMFSTSLFCSPRASLFSGVRGLNVLNISVRTTNVCNMTTSLKTGTLAVLAISSRVGHNRGLDSRSHRGSFGSVVVITLRATVGLWLYLHRGGLTRWVCGKHLIPARGLPLTTGKLRLGFYGALTYSGFNSDSRRRCLIRHAGPGQPTLIYQGYNTFPPLVGGGRMLGRLTHRQSIRSRSLPSYGGSSYSRFNLSILARQRLCRTFNCDNSHRHCHYGSYTSAFMSG